MPRNKLKRNLDSRSAIDLALQDCRHTSFRVCLFRSRKSGRVLYLEADKDFVDTLLSFLLLPLGNVIHMLAAGVPQEKPVGAISSIFHSVEELDISVLHLPKSSLLVQPRPASNNPLGLSKATTSTGLLFLCQDSDATRPRGPMKKKLVLPEQFYKCDSCTLLSTSRGARCTTCRPESWVPGTSRFKEGPLRLSPDDVQRQDDFVSEQEPVEEYNCATGTGFVKENVTFLVTDALEIKPSTSRESMSVLVATKIGSLADVERKMVTVTITQVLQLLRSALTSSSCLNDVFGTGKSSESSGNTSSDAGTNKIPG